MNKTSIEWTHRPQTGGAAGGFTWNAIHAHARGETKTGNFCTRISPGCANCYASSINIRRGNGLEYTVPNLARAEFYLDDRELHEPLKRKKPATIFVGDMFDLFHEAIPYEMILNVFLAMIEAKQHTFQVLTKRAERMRALISSNMYRPFPHIWFGVSVEDKKRADERIPLLLQTPAAVRFLSVEPQLEAVDLRGKDPQGSCLDDYENDPKIDWVICGGESGPGARRFDLAWAESLRDQCEAAGVAFFMKQLGSKPQVHSCRNEKCTHPDCGLERVRLKDRKGGDINDWPESLRVRQWPA